MSITGLTLSLALTCAPNVAPETIARIVQVESGNQVFALNVNKLKDRQPRAKTAAEAAGLARHYIARGHTVDMGLMQINSANLRRLGYTVEDMFDPCTNLQAGSTILAENYVAASRQWNDPQKALQAALSAYNTGNFKYGFKNGYVAKFMRGPASISLPDGDSEAEIATHEALPATTDEIEDYRDPSVVLVRDLEAPAYAADFHALGQPANPFDAATSVIGNWSVK